MGSFLAFVPGPTASLSAHALCREIAEHNLPCHVEDDEDGAYIVFDGSADILHLTIVDERVDYLEHPPDYAARLPGDIGDALTSIGFEWVDEDDPRWRAG